MFMVGKKLLSADKQNERRKENEGRAGKNGRVEGRDGEGRKSPS